MSITIGEIIKYYRTSRKICQEDLANGICTRRQLSNIECNNSTPSLDLICDFSNRLNINLLSAFGNVYRHQDLPTHLKFVELAKAISSKDISTLENHISDCESNENFKIGEPRTLLAYAKAVSFSLKGDAKSANTISKEELTFLFPDFPKLFNAPDNLSNVEYALLLTYSITECRLGNTDMGISLFDEISSRIKRLLSDSLYDSEEKKDFWTSLWCSAVYNKFCFMNDSALQMKDEIDEILEYQKTNNRIHILPELLLCKTIILIKEAKFNEAYEEYTRAKTIGEFYTSKENFERITESFFSMNPGFSSFISE